MRISIIVPAYNEEKLLGATLIAIREATVPWTRRGWTYELIVSDNNSTDRTAEIATAAGAQVVFEPLNQIARARNRGASVATGDWLLFIDADSLPSPDLFADLAEAITSGHPIACGATLRFASPGLLLRFLTTAWTLWSRWRGRMAGSFVAVEATAFREVAGFPDDFFVGEELELSRRLQKLGRSRAPAQPIRILSKHPLLTSDRKMALYSFREMLVFTFRGLLRPQCTMRNAQASHMWYDGRR